MLLFTTHNVLTEKNSSLGYLMLQCLRSYLNLDMWVLMEVHTENTIRKGCKELLCFSKLINVRDKFYCYKLYGNIINGPNRNMLKLKGHLMWKMDQILNSLQLKTLIFQKCMLIAMFLTTS